MFVFDRTQELMAEGYRAMRQLVPELLRLLEAPEEGIFPKTPVRIHVDRARCVGCGACALRAPGIFQMDALGKAEVVAPRQAWSPLDGVYIRNCPTWAISARPVTGEWSGAGPLPIAASPPPA
jgi:ferredoxin